MPTLYNKIFPVPVQVPEYECIDASARAILWVWSLKVYNLLELFTPELKHLFMSGCHAVITTYKRNKNIGDITDMLVSSKTILTPEIECFVLCIAQTLCS